MVQAPGGAEVDVVCRCASLVEASGATARSYAAGHLVVEERSIALDRYAPGHDLKDEQARDSRWLAMLRGTADAELVCPRSGWRFREHIGRHGDEYRLKRRPMTAREDYLSHDIVRGGPRL